LKFAKSKYDYLLSDLIQYIDKNDVDYIKVNKLCSYFVLEEDDCEKIKKIVYLMNRIVQEWTGDWVSSH
jgi:hypothetical protein